MKIVWNCKINSNSSAIACSISVLCSHKMHLYCMLWAERLYMSKGMYTKVQLCEWRGLKCCSSFCSCLWKDFHVIYVWISSFKIFFQNTFWKNYKKIIHFQGKINKKSNINSQKLYKTIKKWRICTSDLQNHI